MKKYVCDICDDPITQPHELKMREFYVGYTYEIGIGAIPQNARRKKKLHMCDDCYQEFVFTCREKKIRRSENHEQT